MHPPLPLYHMNQLCPSTEPEALTVQAWVPPVGAGGSAPQLSAGITRGGGGGGGAIAGAPFIPVAGWPMPAVIPFAAGGGVVAPPGGAGGVEGAAPEVSAPEGATGRFGLGPSVVGFALPGESFAVGSLSTRGGLIPSSAPFAPGLPAGSANRFADSKEGTWGPSAVSLAPSEQPTMANAALMTSLFKDIRTIPSRSRVCTMYEVCLRKQRAQRDR